MKHSHWLKYLLHASVLGGLIIAAVKFVDGGDFLRALSKFQWAYLPFVCALSLASIFVKGERFVTMMRRITDAPRDVLRRAYVSGQACTLIPGGAAARAGILEQAGIPAGETAAPLAVSSLTDQAMFLGCTVIAALWVESIRRPVAYALTFLILLSVVLGIEACRTWLLGVITRLMGKLKILEHWRDFLVAMRRVATWPVILGGLVNTAIAFSLLLAALYLCVQGVGATVHPTTLLLAFTLPTMIGRISAMPGGVGVTEAGMMSILGSSPDVSFDQAAATVAVFRVATVLLAAVFGGLVYLFAWKGHREAKRVERAEKEALPEPEAAA
jgi:uncharacterized protein (TIRG00374 family)